MAEQGRISARKVGAQVNVIVITYTHKHGSDVFACKSFEKAYEVALGLVEERAQESWDKEDQEKLAKLHEAGEKLELFEEVEKEISYGEVIEFTNVEVL